MLGKGIAHDPTAAELQLVPEALLHKCAITHVLNPTTLQARDNQSGEVLAVKVYKLSALGELNKARLLATCRLLQLSSPCCMHGST